MKTYNREKKLFIDNPVWKTLLITSIPSIIAMLVFGLYTFMDSVLSINLANHAYKQIGFYTPKSQVRLFMSGATPITTFIMAVCMFFGIGISRRFSVHIGAKNQERAIKTLNTTFKIGLLTSFLFMPILFLTSKMWIAAQFSNNPKMASFIADESYKYAWIMILSFPLQMFNQIIIPVFRSEGRNKEMLFALILPIFLNLFLDWVFMGPLKMAINGGAWATFISYVFTMLILFFFIFKFKDSRVKFKNFLNFKNFKFIYIIGVALVGVSPFMRNIAQSITQTIEMSKIQDVSKVVYGNNMQMSLILTAVFPVFALFFPLIFGFIQAGSVIIGYNYGAKKLKRAKETTLWILLFSSIASILIFLISSFIFIDIFNSWLGIQDSQISNIVFFDGSNDVPWDIWENFILHNSKLQSGGMHFDGDAITVWKDPNNHKLGGYLIQKFQEKFHTVDKSRKMFAIMMSSILFFGPSLSAMSLFGSVDRVFLNFFASSLRGLILLVPILFLFSWIAKQHPGNLVENLIGQNSVFSYEYLFWWFYPFLSFLTSCILLVSMIYVFKKINKKRKTLDEKIDNLYLKFDKMNK